MGVSDRGVWVFQIGVCGCFRWGCVGVSGGGGWVFQMGVCWCFRWGCVGVGVYYGCGDVWVVVLLQVWIWCVGCETMCGCVGIGCGFGVCV